MWDAPSSSPSSSSSSCPITPTPRHPDTPSPPHPLSLPGLRPPVCGLWSLVCGLWSLVSRLRDSQFSKIPRKEVAGGLAKRYACAQQNRRLCAASLRAPAQGSVRFGPRYGARGYAARVEQFRKGGGLKRRRWMGLPRAPVSPGRETGARHPPGGGCRGRSEGFGTGGGRA